MRILQINTVPTEKNGITNVIFNFHRAMDKTKLTMDLVAINPPEAEYAHQIEASGGRIFVLNRSMRGVLAYVRALAAVIRRGHYDAVHAHGNSATLFFEMAAAWLGGCKVRIAHSHSTTCKFLKVHTLLKPFFYLLCTHRLACGKSAGAWLYGSRSFEVLQNGIDTARYCFHAAAREEIRNRYGIAAETRLLVHVGQFDENKNQKFLVELLRDLCKESGAYHLMLLGDGPDREVIEEQIRKWSLSEKVTLVGQSTEVSRFLSAADLFLLPSRYEGVPLSLVEAQAAGLPCLVSDSVSFESDLTGNVTFLPVMEGTLPWKKGIAAVHTEVSREVLSEQARLKICQAGYSAAEEAGKLLRYYEKAVGK